MKIGIHTSSSPRLVSAAEKAAELGADCFQMFSSSPRMWRAAPPDPGECDAFRAGVERHALRPVVIHDSYLINLASADPVIRPKSIAAFRGELERAIALDADYLVMHPGSHKDQTLEQGIDGLARALVEASQGLKPASRFCLLLENTAGAGSTIGRTFEELAAIQQRVEGRLPFPVAYCLDTCHLYASGYEVTTAAGLKTTLKQAETVLGLERVPVIHTNDSKGALGSRLDRHANIGEGLIGLEGFRRILNHADLRDKAFVLETPVDNPGDDQRNVDTLKSLCRKRRTTTKPSN